MRSSETLFPVGWDEYRIVLANISRQVVSTSNGMSVGFSYQSAKDVLKWNNLSPKQYVKTVMAVGSIYHLTDKQFEDYKNDSEYLEFTADELKEQYEK